MPACEWPVLRRSPDYFLPKHPETGIDFPFRDLCRIISARKIPVFTLFILADRWHENYTFSAFFHQKNKFMIKTLIAFFTAIICLQSCNSGSKDSVQEADSTNKAKMDQSPQALQTDEATSSFLVKAADGGMAEVNAGKMGETKSMNEEVKRFSTMMVNDHTAANAKVKSLADARNITLPVAPSAEHTKKADDLGKKTGKDFDKAYMDMMVDDHQKTIDLFEKASNDSKDEEVKTFITNTLPTLKMHLDSAKAVQKMIH
jgi:putative membrane protein